MGQRGRKYKEDVPADFVIDKINTMPISKLMPVAKIVCGSDYAVSHYQSKNHPKFYHNQEAFRKALRRCFAIGAFEHRSTIINRLNLKEEYVYSQVERYSKNIEDHTDEIVKEVNNEFDHCREFIRRRILNKIKEYLEIQDVHYEWVRGDCPYDTSGELVKDGLINLNQSVYNFLENEYCGMSLPTYESGCGLHYLTYGDLVSDLTFEIGENIMQQVMKKYICETLEIHEYTEELIMSNHDLIYDKSKTCDFFFWEAVLEFCNIGNILLCDI